MQLATNWKHTLQEWVASVDIDYVEKIVSIEFVDTDEMGARANTPQEMRDDFWGWTFEYIKWKCPKLF